MENQNQLVLGPSVEGVALRVEVVLSVEEIRKFRVKDCAPEWVDIEVTGVAEVYGQGSRLPTHLRPFVSIP